MLLFGMRRELGRWHVAGREHAAKLAMGGFDAEGPLR